MKRKVTQLFTAAVLVAGAPITANANPRTLPTGAPACGNVSAKVRPARCRTAPTQTEPMTPTPITTVATNANPRTPQVLQKLLSLFGVTTTQKAVVAKPRTFRDGAPANGNVHRRSPGPVEEPRREQVEPPPSNNN